MTILFFSSTGNSLSIAKLLGGNLKSIPQLERAGEYEIIDDVIGIVSPVYNHTLPLIVRRFLSKTKLKADYIFGILTYGFISGTSAKKLANALIANGNLLHYAANLLMADTYLPVFKMENEIARLPKKDVNARFKKIRQDIGNRRCYVPQKNLFLGLLSALISRRMESAKGISATNLTDSRFIVSENCSRCGTCAHICPVSNIKIENKPVFSHNCESCFACIQNCPAGALQLKGQRSKARYRNNSVTLKELIRVNGK